MKLATGSVLAGLTAALMTVFVTALPAAATAPPVEETFRKFALFGDWAVDCKRPATPANPHVSITMPSAGLVLEDHDVGSNFAINRYSVLSARRISPTRLSIEVIFKPGVQGEERQTLMYRVRNGTRRTLFNRAAGGAVRVKNGVALPDKIRTPLLKKCE